jgi:hypothetical protein
MSVCRFIEKSDIYCWAEDNMYILTFKNNDKNNESYNTPFKLFRRLKKLKKFGIKIPNSSFSNIF